MIENLRRTSPGPETGCRRTVSSIVERDGEKQRCIRRKRLALRRSKSLDQLQSGFFKRKRSGNGELVDSKQSDEVEKECSERKAAADVSLSFARRPSNNQLTKEDIVIVGASTFVDDNNIARENTKDVRYWSHGSISVIGRRREMEDAVAVELGFLTKGSKRYDFFGVYDGHGGSRVAHACRDRLHRLLAERVLQEEDESSGGSINWQKVMLESFDKIDEEVNNNGAAVATMGSTAVVAAVGEEDVVVANCGDSRAVLSRGGVAVPLSNDHKPDRFEELERIELSGGRVINWNGQRVMGVLATSRSIGDRYLKPYVISDPEVIVNKRSSEDEFLILASDGLWDVVSNDVACNVVRRCLDGQIKRADSEEMVNGKRTSETTENGVSAADAAAVLAELAIARGSQDNISVIVVGLRRRPSMLIKSPCVPDFAQRQT